MNLRFRSKRIPLTSPLAEETDAILNSFSNLNPPVYLLPGIGQPFVWGLIRGSIYLPADFTKTTTTSRRRAILAHELAHVKRFDALVNLLQIIAQAVFWFHPFVWLANRLIRAEREKACDETAIAKLAASPKDYSSAIVDTLIAEYKSTMPVPSLAVAGPIKNIEDRIKTVMTPGKKFYTRPTFIAVFTILLLAAIIAPTTIALTTRKPKPEETLESVKPQTTSEFKTTLPNGTTVELIGLCEHPSQGKQWWTPDGSLLAEPPSNKIDVGGSSSRKSKAAYEIVAKLTGPETLLSRSSTPEKWEIPQAHKVGLGKSGMAKDKNGVPCLRATTAIVKSGLKKIDIEFGLAGVWEKRLTVSSNESSKQEIRDTGVVINPPYEKDGNATVTIKVPNKIDSKMAINITAVLKNGKVIEGAAWNRNSKIRFMRSTDNYEFHGVNLSDVDRFEIYTSKYQWVTFKNVSLKPNFKTETRVEVSVLADNHEIKRTDEVTYITENYGQTRLLSSKEWFEVNWVSIVASVVKDNGRYHVPDHGLTLKELVKAAGYNRDKLAESYISLHRISRQGNMTARSIYSRNLKTLLSGKESDIAIQPNDAVVGGYIEPSPNAEEFWGQYAFGNVVELTVNDDGAKVDMFADLDKAKLITPPDTLNNTDENAVLGWIKDNGIDVMGESADSVHGMVGFNMYAARVDNYFWDADKIEITDRLMVSVDSPILLSADKLFPVTYLIKTSEHKMGVLQILGFAENPRGIKIRYKLLNQNVSLQPGKNTKPTIQIEKELPKTKPVTEKPNFSATLPDGSVVELIGLCEHPSQGKKWWKPNGTLLNEPPYEHLTTRSYPTENESIYELAFKSDVFNNDVSVRIKAVPDKGSHGAMIPQKGMKPILNLRAFHIEQSQGLENCGVSLGVAAGPWQTLSVSDGTPSVVGRSKRGSIAFSEAIENKEGDVIVTVSHDLPEQNCRIVASTIKGGLIKSQRLYGLTGGTVRQITATFEDVKLREIKQFQFQTRPYQWIQFKNVSLQPGKNTNVQITQSAPADHQPEKSFQSMPPQHISFKKDMYLTDALRFLALKYQQNIIPSAAVANARDRLAITNLYDVTSLEQALDAILGSHKYVIDGKFIRIYTQEEFDALPPDQKANQNPKTAKISAAD